MRHNPTHTRPAPGDYRFSYGGEVIRVIVAGDVLALPGEGWALGGFGQHISVEWLLTQPRHRLPGRKARWELLATCRMRALEEHRAAERAAAELRTSMRSEVTR